MTDEEMLQFINLEVLKFFEGDKTKAQMWMKTKNLNLGDIAPDRLIALGKTQRVYNFVKNAIEGNMP